MCINRRHVQVLDRTNESDYEAGKISTDTYIRFKALIERCETCHLCENGKQGDMDVDCKFALARAFSAMKWDAERRINERWTEEREMDEEEVAEALKPHLAPLPPRERLRARG